MKIHDFQRKKLEKQKIAMITCYDYPSACIVSESNIDCVLVGDSVAMAVHGHNTTITATLDMMELHTLAVARGLKNQFLISDLPFLSHKKSLADTVDSAARLLQAGAHALKIEGADHDTCNTIQHLVHAGVPIMGHIGLTPQSIHQLGGFKIQGKNQSQIDILIKQALDLQAAGCFALVIECVPAATAEAISLSITIPTIGIGAGYLVDGQVLVWHDMLGLQTHFNPKFVKRYAYTKELLLDAINSYVQQVQLVDFPALEHCF